MNSFPSNLSALMHPRYRRHIWFRLRHQLQPQLKIPQTAAKESGQKQGGLLGSISAAIGSLFSPAANTEEPKKARTEAKSDTKDTTDKGAARPSRNRKRPAKGDNPQTKTS